MSNIPDDILDKVLRCEVTNKAYKIIPMELSFYRKSNTPIPRVHPNERHESRVRMLLPSELFVNKCDLCKKDIYTPYKPGRPEKVYCEKCYQQEVL